ncbi:MAG: rod shape-determining protein MreD [Bacillota bacterium]|uniref:Rod shape-determining protein MreD n=1 Tax=[Clostridium] aminophilum TaxID=1526 RepID=A0A1I6IMA5_9FIRM|nr:rod shape-determining protein MreD [[Clostridium] aminophilum]MCR4629778.1 rod shape-determining protein MreD [Clostridium sp.]MDT3843507.1 rod shape-determining protein MreD [Bacillota bacterium]SFR67846.1 rod shape-determining protein MreD [[Clostridium] aminophilum]
MRKIIINIVLLILAFTAQVCLFPQISILASWPNLLLIIVSICAFIEGRRMGIIYGLVAGLVMDLFYSGAFGFYTLFFVNMGFLNGCFTRYYYEDYITLPLTLAILNDLAYNLYIYIFRFLVQGKLNFGYYFVKIILPEVIFTTVTTLVIYRLLLFINHMLTEWDEKQTR